MGNPAPILTTLLLLIPAAASAQNHSSHLHTGNAVIDLRTQPATVSCPVSLDALEGTATWSDPITGDLRFYTNGTSVYDASTGLPVAGGNGTLGSPSNGVTQAALIAAVPGTSYEQLYNAQVPAQVLPWLEEQGGTGWSQ